MRIVLILISAAALITLSPGGASAQSDPTASAKSAARSLANEGFKAFDKHDYKAAAELFRQADEKFHAVTLVVMQANSLVAGGTLLEARDLYKRVVAEPLPVNPPKEFIDAQKEAQEVLLSLSDRIPWVRVTVLNAPGNLLLTIDGVEIPTPDAKQRIERNPGVHTIIASVEGHEPVTRSITLAEKAHEEVTLMFPPSPAPSPPSLPPFSAPFSAPAEPQPLAEPLNEPTPEAPPPTSPIPATLVLGAGAVGLGVGVVTGVMWLNRNSDIFLRCNGNDCPRSLEPEIDTAKNFGRAALAGLIIGGVGAGVGVALLVNRGSGESSTASSKATLVVGPGSLTLKGAF